jgi:hypothetical protein
MIHWAGPLHSSYTVYKHAWHFIDDTHSGQDNWKLFSEVLESMKGIQSQCAGIRRVLRDVADMWRWVKWNCITDRWRYCEMRRNWQNGGRIMQCDKEVRWGVAMLDDVVLLYCSELCWGCIRSWGKIQIIQRSMMNDLRVADEVYIKKGCLVWEEFLFFSLYSFSCMAKQVTTLKQLRLLSNIDPFDPNLKYCLSHFRNHICVTNINNAQTCPLQIWGLQNSITHVVCVIALIYSYRTYCAHLHLTSLFLVYKWLYYHHRIHSEVISLYISMRW